MNEKEKKVEAILFAVGKEITTERVANLCSLNLKEVEKVMKTLQKHYSESENSFHLIKKDNGWKLTVRDEFVPLVSTISWSVVMLSAKTSLSESSSSTLCSTSLWLSLTVSLTDSLTISPIAAAAPATAAVIAGQLPIITGVRINTAPITVPFYNHLQQLMLSYISSLRLSSPGSLATSALVAILARPSAHLRNSSISSLIVLDNGTVSFNPSMSLSVASFSFS